MNPFKFAALLVQSMAWDAASSIIEMSLLGMHGWWWKLHCKSQMLYWREGPFRLANRSGPQALSSRLDFTYGETPPFSFIHMLRTASVTCDDVVVDLGCGRGLHLLAAARLLGVQARGYDLVEGFIERGRILAKTLRIEERVRFECQDFCESDLQDASIIHITATTFSELTRQRLLGKLQGLPSGTRLITHDWHLPPQHFQLIGSRRYPVTWGWSTITFYQTAP